MSYYKYNPRDPQVQVNWTEAAANLTSTIQDEVTLRAEKKGAIDDATRKYQEQLNNQPQGESTSIREWGLAFGDKAQKQMLMQEQLLKSGMLSPSQYTQMRQNLVDGTEQAFSLQEHYQSVYADKMERMKSNDIATSSQELEVWLMENAEGYANFNNSELAINPETGKVTAAMMRTNSETGLRELTTNENQFVAVSSLQGQILTNYDEFDVGAVTTKFVDETGAWTSLERVFGSRQQAGAYITTIDPTQKTLSAAEADLLGIKYGDNAKGIEDSINLYIQAENAAIDAVFGDPYNLTSILTENVVKTAGDTGKNYTFTLSPSEAKAHPEMILMEKQGGRNVPVFGEPNKVNGKKQQEDIRSWMRVDIRNKINKDQKAVSVSDWQRASQPSAVSVQTGKQAKEQGNILSNINYLWSGNDQQVDEAINFLKGANDNISTITRSKEGIIITYADGSDNQEVDFINKAKPEKNMTQEQFLKGYSNYFLSANDRIKDTDKIIKQANITFGQTLSDVNGFGGNETTKTESESDAYKRVVTSEMDTLGFNVNSFVANNVQKTAQNLTGFVTSLPGMELYTVKQGSGGIVEILDGSSTPVVVDKFSVNGMTPADQAAYLKRLIERSRKALGSDGVFDYVQGQQTKTKVPAVKSNMESLELN
tara:strand:- start:3107 stop:5065 length:1959 start_codon:yes stop_codon:yes gene_type:complete